MRRFVMQLLRERRRTWNHMSDAILNRTRKLLAQAGMEFREV